MVVFEVVIYGILEHVACSGKHGVAELRSRKVKMSAALELFKNKLNVYLALASTRYRDVVTDSYQREGCLYSLDGKEIVCNSCGDYTVVLVCLSFKVEPGYCYAIAVYSRL